MTGMSVDGRADGKMGRGAVMHCAHGKERLYFEIVDWRPFETVSMDLALPLGAVVRITFELRETPEGVHVEARLKPTRTGDGMAARLLARPMLAMAAGKIEKSFRKSLATLARVVSEDIASGKVERWQPAVRAS